MDNNKTNPFYMDNKYDAETNGLNAFHQCEIRENNIYMFKILTNIFNNNGKTNRISNNYRTQILSGKLIHSDKNVDNGVGEKLKALILALDKDPVARETFNNSAFSSVIKLLFTGRLYNDDKTGWAYYTPSDDCADVYKNKTALNVALACYRANREMVGFDLDKLISTIVTKNKKGAFIIKDTATTEQFNQMVEGMSKFITSLKQDPLFNKNFVIERDDQENE